MRWLRSRARRTPGLLVALFVVLGCNGGGPESGSMLFLSPKTNAIALSGDGDVLYVADTTRGTLSLHDVSGPGAPSKIAEIHVGLDPVAIAVRPKLDADDALEDELVLVANHISDSVSVVSRMRQEVVQIVQELDADGVSRTNEPTGIAFASRDRAFLTLDEPNQVAVLDLDGTGRVSLNPTRLDISAQGPRAVAAADGLVYVASFESGNQTEFPTCLVLGDPRGLDESDPDDEGCEFDILTDGFRFVFDPNLGGRVIRDRDQPDRDLFVFDAATLAPVEVVETLGTLHYGLVASGSKVWMTSTEGLNQHDGLDALQNRMFENRLVLLDCQSDCTSGAQLLDLDQVAGQPVPTPYGVGLSADESTLVLTAFGSDGRAGAPGLFTTDASGAVQGSVEVGALPVAVALRSDAAGAPETAFVLSGADGSVAVVDVSDPSAPNVTHSIAATDPAPADVLRGRVAFASASASTSGTFSCESCHPQGHTDQLIWTINTAQGPNDPLGPSGEKPEPRTTMPVRGLKGTLPLHWDGTLGDPLPGAFVPGDTGSDCDLDAPDGEHACFRHLVNASLSGVMCEQPCDSGGALSEDERDDMAVFLRSLPYPPSPQRRPSDVPTAEALAGLQDFFTNDDGGGSQALLTCGSAGGGCHVLPHSVGTNSGFVGGFDAPTIRGMWDRFLLFSNGMFQAEEALVALDAVNSVAVWDPAVGHTERGSFLATFPDQPFIVGQGGGFLAIYGVRGEDIWQLINELSVGFAGILGRQLEVTAANADDADVVAAMDQIEAMAAEGRVVGVARSNDLGEYRLDPASGRWRRGETTASGAGLRAMVTGDSVLTLTAEHAPLVATGAEQPLLWGNVGRPQAGAESTFLLQSSGVADDAHVLVDGVRCDACSFSLLDAEDPKRLVLTLAPAPGVGPHGVQVHNPRGLVSNEMPIVAE